MRRVSMCHDHNSSEYVWTGPHREADDEDETEDETPSFLNEEGDAETEILTDGGE